MRTHIHTLVSASPGTQRYLHSLHFGPLDCGRKAVIQASLHADEPPGMLVAHHLREQLHALEGANALLGEVVLVPAANPLGMNQRVLGRGIGRFALDRGENFNRHYADLSAHAAALLEPLDATSLPGVAQIRAASRTACMALEVHNELASLRKFLLGIAIDADLVIDLHCDTEGLLHLYTTTPLWDDVMPLARALGTELNLLAEDSGDDPFDEACSMFWNRLAARLSARLGRSVSLPNACVAVTVELRGEADVSHELAQRDANALIAYLRWRGFIAGNQPALDPLRRAPRPLSGSMPLLAPSGGVLVFLRGLGSELREGDIVAEIIDPLGNTGHPVRSPIDGLLYARESTRIVHAGTSIGKVAGIDAVRTGKLLSA